MAQEPVVVGIEFQGPTGVVPSSGVPPTLRVDPALEFSESGIGAASA
jgi:hypothetical protein